MFMMIVALRTYEPYAIIPRQCKNLPLKQICKFSNYIRQVYSDISQSPRTHACNDETGAKRTLFVNEVAV